jgi:molybdenum cofactor sulfurtransferase
MLKSLKHINGQKMINIYQGGFACGPIIAFNIHRDNGSFFSYYEVSRLAISENFHLRSGRFCNPGAAQNHLKLDSDTLRKLYEIHGYVCGDGNDIFENNPTGCLRISFGYSNTMEDISRFHLFLTHYFQEKGSGIARTIDSNSILMCNLERIFIYPIKSCAAFEVNNWELSQHGLLFDRRFMLVDLEGQALTQKRIAKMNLISIDLIDITDKIMKVSAPGMEYLSISLQCSDILNRLEAGASLCSNSVTGQSISKAVDEWFSLFLDIPCRLLETTNSNAAYFNTSPFLLISKSSVETLKDSIPAGVSQEHVSAISFRPNFVISASEPFAEEDWKDKILQFGEVQFNGSFNCERCNMIGVDEAARRHREPLRTLASRQRKAGKIVFGIHLEKIHSRIEKISICQKRGNAINPTTHQGFL